MHVLCRIKLTQNLAKPFAKTPLTYNIVQHPRVGKFAWGNWRKLRGVYGYLVAFSTQRKGTRLNGHEQDKHRYSPLVNMLCIVAIPSQHLFVSQHVMSDHLVRFHRFAVIEYA